MKIIYKLLFVCTLICGLGYGTGHEFRIINIVTDLTLPYGDVLYEYLNQ